MGALQASPIRNPQRLSIPPRLPLKQVRYALPRPIARAKSVTVCIAAICENNREPRIVLCADTRLDASYTGSTEGNLKIGKLACGFLSMLSGDFMAATDIHERIKAEMLSKGPPPDKTKLYNLLMRVGKSYLKSPLNVKLTADLIVAGFIGQTAVIATLGVSDTDTPTVSFSPAYRAVGSGSSIAETLLSIRDYTTQDSVERAIYVLYEAKKYSERAAGVGPDTKLIVIAPVPASALPEQVKLFSLTGDTIAELEEMRLINGIQKISALPIGLLPFRLSPATLPDPPRPTDEPSPQPPSPESSEESGES